MESVALNSGWSFTSNNLLQPSGGLNTKMTRFPRDLQIPNAPFGSFGHTSEGDTDVWRGAYAKCNHGVYLLVGRYCAGTSLVFPAPSYVNS